MDGISTRTLISRDTDDQHGLLARKGLEAAGDRQTYSTSLLSRGSGWPMGLSCGCLQSPDIRNTCQSPHMGLLTFGVRTVMVTRTQMEVPRNALFLKVVNQMIWGNNRDCGSMMSRWRDGNSLHIQLVCLPGGIARWVLQNDLDYHKHNQQ